ncbi:unnamed protein product [Schistosoma mattheei]|uniref:Uncharacterized protein n=1 Tax=Schistosoma mattheei TaxID=31246 RepID=A0A183Q3R9_9TREM|nr:unnamed protein product [Schistosoma mattheei]
MMSLQILSHILKMVIVCQTVTIKVQNAVNLTMLYIQIVAQIRRIRRNKKLLITTLQIHVHILVDVSPSRDLKSIT